MMHATAIPNNGDWRRPQGQPPPKANIGNLLRDGVMHVGRRPQGCVLIVRDSLYSLTHSLTHSLDLHLAGSSNEGLVALFHVLADDERALTTSLLDALVEDRTNLIGHD